MTKATPSPRRSRESPRRMSPPSGRRTSSPPNSSRPTPSPRSSSGRQTSNPSPMRQQSPQHQQQQSLSSPPSSPRYSQQQQQQTQQQQLLPPISPPVALRQQQTQPPSRQQQQQVAAQTPPRRLQRTFSAGRQQQQDVQHQHQSQQQQQQQASPSSRSATRQYSSSPRQSQQREQQQQLHLQHKPIPAKLPSPSSKSSTLSPSKRNNSRNKQMLRQHQATPPPPPPPPPPPDTLTFSPTRSSSGQSADCLDTSLQMLRRSMKDNAKAYEYLLETAAVKAEQSGIIIGIGGGGNGNGGGGNGNGGNGGGAPEGGNGSNSWMSILHKLREQHEEEKSQWKKDLKEAKEKTKHFKHELRDNLTERLHWLESKVRHQIQSPQLHHPQPFSGSAQQHHNHHPQEGTSSVGLTRSSTSTMTQTSTEDETAGYHTAEGGGDGTVVEVGEGGVLKEKEEGAIEVIFNTLSQEAVRQRIHELEDDLQATIHHHMNAQKEWARSLDEAAAVTANSTALSAHMQKLLQDVATDLRKTYHDELQAAEERSQELQSDLRTALAKYQEDKALWQQETAKLKDDSRRLLSERKAYEAQLSEKQQKVIAVEDSVGDMKRQVELAQRQTSVAKKQVARLQEKLAEQQRLSATTTDRRNPDPPSPTRPGDLKEKFQRVIQERDALQREAEETVSMLGDYQKQLEKERSIFANQQKAMEKKWQAETERKIKEFREAQIAQYSKKPLSEVPHAEMERRYRDSVEKRNEMAGRMRKVELQHAADKGSWKLQLESTLVESRHLSAEKARLETALDEAKKNHEAETQVWHDRVKQMTAEWNQKVHDLKTSHYNECVRLRGEISEVQAAKNGTEAAVIQNRNMLEEIKNQHRAELMDWKERLVGQNKQTISEMEEHHKKQIENLEKERANMQKFIQELEKQLTEMETTHADEIAEWTEEIRSAVMEHENRMSELKEEHQTDAEEWKALIIQLQQQNDELLADKEEQQEVNKTQIEENENLREELQGWIQKTEQLQARIEELNRSHQHEISLVEDKVKKAEDSAAERVQLASQKHQEELETLCQQVSAQHKEEISLLEQTNEKTIIQLQELHEEKIGELEQTNEQEIVRLQELHEEKMATQEAAHKAKVTELHQEHERKITELEMTLKEKDSTYESIVAEWRDNHGTLSKEKEQLEATQKDLKAEIAQWKEKADELEKAMAELTENSTKLEAGKKILEEAIQQLQSEREEVELELHDRADLFLEEKNRLETLLEEKNSVDSEWKEKAEKLEAKIKEMKKSHKETLQEWNSVATKLEKSRDAHEKDKKEMEEQLAHWRSKAEKLESAIGMSENGLVEVSALHAGEIQDLKDKMNTLRAENERQLELARQACEEEINQWKKRLESTQNEYKSKISVFKGEHNREAKRWRKELDAAEEKTRALAEQTNILSATLEELNEAHSNTEKRWEADLAKAMAENQLVQAERERVQAEKERVQAELSRLRQNQEKLEVNMSMKSSEDDRLEMEVSRLATENEKLQHASSKLKTDKEDKAWQELAIGLEQRQAAMTNAVEELRKDVVSVRETLLTSTKTEELVQDAHFGEIRDSLEEIQSGLNDAVAELTLETEAMIENREYLKSLAESLNKSKCFEQQERLLADIGALSENLKVLMDKENGEASGIRDKLRADLASELHNKEVALAAITAEIETVRTQLSTERGLRERAEQEILTLNDQADAYGEELMRLQGINKGLEDTLKQAEIRMQSALLYGEGEQTFDDNGDIKKASTADSSSPMLEEALLLAQNVKDLVDGKCGHEKETTVMEMLETLSDMMDLHDRGETMSRGKSEVVGSSASMPIQVVEISSTPRGRSVECVTSSRKGGGFHFDSVPPDRLVKLTQENDMDQQHHDEPPPSPVMSPPGKENHADAATNSIHKNSKLHLVVDQLYGRCQLLERERTELMEVTLDLLQSARDANAAELDAALSTARRKSAEELLKVREQNQEGMWRLYHKLCGNCQVGLIKSSGGGGGSGGADSSPCQSLQPSQATNLNAPA